LDKIKGIGPKTVALLIDYFGSVKKVNTAKKTELIQLIGKSKAGKILK
jgi:excinuclease UvrABC nuclease subunit